MTIFCNLIVFFIAVTSVFSVADMTISCDGANDYLKEVITNKILDDNDRVEFLSLEVKRMTADLDTNCDTLSFKLPKYIPLNNDLIIKVDSYNEDGFIKRKTQVFRFIGDAKIYKTVKTIYDKDVFSMDHLYETSIKIQRLSKRMISKLEDVSKYQYRNYVDKNQILETWMLERIPDINKGDAITAVYSKSNITLTLDAQILENGFIGEPVKIKLEKNKKVMLGTIYDKETVIISSR